MLVPVAGPWLALTESFTASQLAPFLVVDGLVQAAGLSLLIGGLVTGRTVLVRQEPVPGYDPRMPMQWSVAPHTTPTSVGLSVSALGW